MVGGTAMLRVWEQGHALSSLERGALALRTWGRNEDESEFAIDEMNRRLLELRSRLFGRKMEFYAECEKCGEALEFSVDALNLASETGPHSQPPLLVDGREIECRPPTAADILAAAATPDPRRELVERCLQANDGALGTEAEFADLTVERIEDWLQTQYPLLEIHLGVTCPSCAHKWDQLLDIDAVLWRDIDHQARRLLVDVDQLARKYGWSESDILELSPQRRIQYLGLSG